MWQSRPPWSARRVTAFLSVILAMTLVGLTAGCRSAPVARQSAAAISAEAGATLTQVATIDGLLVGAYDGYLSLAELTRHGDFGIGTFTGLDGEMVVLDGAVYQVRADGHVYLPPPTATTPYAVVTAFHADRSLPLAGADFAALERAVDAAAPNRNAFVAIRVTGRFTAMKTRSVPAQQKPYPPLVEVTKNQPVFELQQVSGTLVGFRAPAYAKGLTVPGYHLHFLADDHQSGGHVLAFQLERGTVELAGCRRFVMLLPPDESDFSRADLSADRSKDLQRAEQ